MTEIATLKSAFIQFIEKILPSIQDPMSITQQKCQMLINLLKDEKPISNVVLFIQNLKIGILKPQVNKEEDKQKSPLKPPLIVDHGLFQPESFFKLNLPNKDLIIKQSSCKDAIKSDSPNNGIQNERPQEETSTPLKLGIDKIKKTPKMNATFNMFFQQVKGFSIVAREYILDDLQTIMKEFRNHTMIMGCIEQRSFLVNSGEITEVDKKLHQQNYNFTTYTQQIERQKSFKKMSIFEQKKKDDSPLKPSKPTLPDPENKVKNETTEQNCPKSTPTGTYGSYRPTLFSQRAQQRLQQQQQQQQIKQEQEQQQIKTNEQQQQINENTNVSEKNHSIQTTVETDQKAPSPCSEIKQIGSITSSQEPPLPSKSQQSYNTVSLPVSPHTVIPKIEPPQPQHNRGQSSIAEEAKTQTAITERRPTYTRYNNYTQQRLEQAKGLNSYRASTGYQKQDIKIDMKQLDNNF